MTLLKFESIKTKRKQCIFRNKPVFITPEDEEKKKFPCIALYEQATGIPLLYPGFERWYLDVEEEIENRGGTLLKKANNIRSFLNFILWETDVNMISEVDTDIIRQFYKSFKETDDGDPRDPDGWNRGIEGVAYFLNKYSLHNSNRFEFHYDRNDLYKPDTRKKGGMTVNRFGVKSPKKVNKKGRFILEGYRDMILQECWRHDPMIRLGAALQSAAGIREGEVVNLTRSSIDPILGSYGRIDELMIDLMDEAPFAKEYCGKSEFGRIKKYRKQSVYTEFVREIYDMYTQHERLLDNLGADKSPNAPLFINKYGRPMSVETYKRRLKSVFQDYFVPDLQKLCMRTGNWGDHAPFIEMWTDHIDPKTGKLIRAVYPGAHMFRHWFTMYLLNHTALEHEEIADMRGDNNPNSMMDYIHVNSRMIRTFKEVIWTFQDEVMQAVINGY